jgi:hypothetical protein
MRVVLVVISELRDMQKKFSVRKLHKLNYFKVVRATELKESVKDAEFERLLNETIKNLLVVDTRKIRSILKYNKSFKRMEKYVFKNIFHSRKYNFDEGLKSFVKSNTFNIGRNPGAGIKGASAMKAVEMTFDDIYNTKKE